MQVLLNEDQIEWVCAILSAEYDFCFNMVRSMDGRPADDDELLFWQAELAEAEELLDVFLDADDEDPDNSLFEENT